MAAICGCHRAFKMARGVCTSFGHFFCVCTALVVARSRSSCHRWSAGTWPGACGGLACGLRARHPRVRRFAWTFATCTLASRNTLDCLPPLQGGSWDFDPTLCYLVSASLSSRGTEDLAGFCRDCRAPLRVISRLDFAPHTATDTGRQVTVCPLPSHPRLIPRLSPTSAHVRHILLLGMRRGSTATAPGSGSGDTGGGAQSSPKRAKHASNAEEVMGGAGRRVALAVRAVDVGATLCTCAVFPGVGFVVCSDAQAACRVAASLATQADVQACLELWQAIAAGHGACAGFPPPPERPRELCRSGVRRMLGHALGPP